MTHSIDSSNPILQRLLLLSEQLERVEQTCPVTDLFVKTTDSKTVFEPRKSGALAKARQWFKQRVFSKKYDFAKNMQQLQFDFKQAHEIDPEAFGKFQKCRSVDVEQSLNGFADRLEVICAHAISVLAEQTSCEKDPKKLEKLQQQIRELQQVVFTRIDVEEKAEKNLNDVLENSIDSAAFALIGTKLPEDRIHYTAELFNRASKRVVADGIRIKDPHAMRKEFTDRVEKRRTELLSEYQVRFDERLAETSALVSELLEQSSIDMRRQRCKNYFEECHDAIFPTGFVLDNQEIKLQEFIQSIEALRTKHIEGQIVSFERKLDAKLEEILAFLPALQLERALEDFSAFAASECPSALSPSDFIHYSQSRLTLIEENMKLVKEQVRGQATEAIGKAKNDIAKVIQASSGNRDAETKALAAHIQAFSLMRQTILESVDMSDSDKKLYLNEIDSCEQQIVQLAASGKSQHIENGPSGLLQVGDNNTLTVTYVTTPAAEKISAAGSAYIRDSVMRAAAYIAMEALLKGPSSVLSSTFLLSLVAPHLAVYATNRVCERLPVGVAQYVKPFMATFATLTLIRCAIPYVHGAIGQIVSTPDTPNVLPNQFATSNMTLTNESFAMPSEGLNATAVGDAIIEATVAMPVNVTESFAMPSEGLNATAVGDAIIEASVAMPVNVTNSFTDANVTEVVTELVTGQTASVVPQLDPIVVVANQTQPITAIVEDIAPEPHITNATEVAIAEKVVELDVGATAPVPASVEMIAEVEAVPQSTWAKLAHAWGTFIKAQEALSGASSKDLSQPQILLATGLAATEATKSASLTQVTQSSQSTSKQGV